MRYTLLSRKGREEGAERKRAQPIIFLRKKMMCNSRRRRPCRSPYFHLPQKGLFVPKVRRDHAKISHQLRVPGAEQRNCGKPQPPTCPAPLSASPTPRAPGRDRGLGPGEGRGPPGRLRGSCRGGWMEPGGARRGPPGGDTGPAAAGDSSLPCSCLHLLMLPVNRPAETRPTGAGGRSETCPSAQLTGKRRSLGEEGGWKGCKNRTIGLDQIYFFFLLFKPNLQKQCHSAVWLPSLLLIFGYAPEQRIADDCTALGLSLSCS